MLPAFVFLINGFFLLITLFLAWRMYQAADVYNKNQGDGVIQTKQKWIILWSLLFLLILAIIATIFNATVSWLSTGSV